MKKPYLPVCLLCASSLVAACGGGGSQGLAPAATHFSVNAPTKAVAGTQIQVTVTALDAANNVAASYAGTVHLSSSDSQAALPANMTLTSGSRTFSVTLRSAGVAAITATDTVTTSIIGTSPAIEVSAGPATHFTVAVPSASQSGLVFAITVTALDGANNIATGYTGTVHFSSTDARAMLAADATLTDGAGPFPATLETAGNQTITATDTISAPLTGTSPSIVVAAGPATHLSVSAPATAQSTVAFNITVTALDAAGNIANGYTGTAQFSSTDTQAVLPANSTLANGTVTLSATLQTLGSQTITATDTGTASIAGASPAITVGAAPPPPFHLSVSAPSAAQSGTAFQFTVSALNTDNSVASNYSGTVQFSSTDGQAILPPNSTLTNGVGSFSATLLTAGSQSITATDTVTAAITTTSASVDVSAGPATHFSVSALSPARSGAAFYVTVTALDAANNSANNYAGTVEFTSTDPKAMLPATSPLTDGTGTFRVTLQSTGSQTITATDTSAASITGTSTAIEVYSNCRVHNETCGYQNGINRGACCPGLVCEHSNPLRRPPYPICVW